MPKQLVGRQGNVSWQGFGSAIQEWVTDSKLGCLQVTSAATLHLFPAGTTIHPNPVSKGSLLFILRGALALQKAPPSEPPHTPAVTQQASAQLRHSQQGTSSPGAVHVTPGQSPLPLLLQDPVDDHQLVGFAGSAAAAMHVPGAQAGINPQAAEADSQAADCQQWELVDDMNRKASLVDSASTQQIVPDSTDRSSEVSSVTAGQTQASGKCTTGSQPANISHASGLVDTVKGQSASSQQSGLIGSAGGQSGLVDRQSALVDRQSGLVDGADKQSDLVDRQSDLVDIAGGQSGLVDRQLDLVDSVGGQSGRQDVAHEQRLAPNSDVQADQYEQTAQKDVLDARGCAFGLPGLILGAPLDARVAAKTVVEAYAIPWALLQVLDSSECTSCSGLV